MDKQIVKNLLLRGLQEGDLQKLVSNVRGDIADVFLQDMEVVSVNLQDSIIQVSKEYDSGVGVRVVAGSRTGFSYTQNFAMDDIKRSFESALGISKYQDKPGTSIMQNNNSQYTNYYSPLTADPIEFYVGLLDFLDKRARTNVHVEQVDASLIIKKELVGIIANDGTVCYDFRPLTRCNISVQIKKGDSRGAGYYGFGGRSGKFDEEAMILGLEEAIRIAYIDADSKPAPAGEFPVVLGNGWTGVLLHEAVGHGLEADFNRKGTSWYSGKIGEMVASKGCTVIDAGNIDNRRGSLNFDDEGVATSDTVLIENGRLVGYMQDKLNAKIMGVNPTGNGRRQDYRHLPLPRMTNTFMLEGQYAQSELIESVDRGLFAVNFSGGQVDIVTGDFVFTTSEAYMIEQGKISYPVKCATLIGNGPQIMQRISMVANDFCLDNGVGTCGKDGQSVPVGVGQPSIKIDKMTVGGVIG